MGKVPREAISPINTQSRPSQYCEMGGRGKTLEAIKSSLRLHKTLAWVYVA